MYIHWFCSGTHSTNTFMYNWGELTISDWIRYIAKFCTFFVVECSHVHRPHTAHFVADIMLWEAQKCSNHPILNIAGTLLPRPNRELHGQVEIMWYSHFTGGATINICAWYQLVVHHGLIPRLYLHKSLVGRTRLNYVKSTTVAKLPGIIFDVIFVS